MRNLLAHWESFVVFAIAIGVLWLVFFVGAKQPDKHTCESIDTGICTCVPNHCLCVPGGRVCEACKAKRK